MYRAEDQWSATLDRGGVVDFFGSVIDVPEQLRFGALEAVQTYVDDVVAHLEVPPVRVRHRRAGTRAHYSQGEIAIPTTHGWAMLPAANRTLLFDGGLLHGVVPGRGPTSAGVDGSAAARSPHAERGGGPGWRGAAGGAVLARSRLAAAAAHPAPARQLAAPRGRATRASASGPAANASGRASWSLPGLRGKQLVLRAHLEPVA